MVGLLTGRPIEGRLAGSLGGALAAVDRGADIVRVHDVAEMTDVVRMVEAVKQAR